MTLTTLCREVNNFFDCERIFDTFKISGGSITNTLPLVNGQYYAIFDSVFNDGVHIYGQNDLEDETFYGAIWVMKVPPDFIALCDKITAWENANANALSSPYQSESFGGYSYTKASGKDGKTASYKDIGEFSNELRKWRKQCHY